MISAPERLGRTKLMGHCNLPGKRISGRNKSSFLSTAHSGTEGGTWRSCWIRLPPLHLSPINPMGPLTQAISVGLEFSLVKGRTGSHQAAFTYAEGAKAGEERTMLMSRCHDRSTLKKAPGQAKGALGSPE